MFNFDCDVKIVDEIMGSGKTTAAINFINNSDEDEKFIYITPYLSEVERIKSSCPDKNFREPYSENGRKLDCLKRFISKGENIVSTHALFHKFDLETIDLCRANNYTLIMDEVTDVIARYEITETDFNILKEKFVDIDEETGLLKWRGNNINYRGKFKEEKRLCELNSLAYYGGSVMMWLFPIEVFNAFRHIYILTYMFNAQPQRYYYDYYNLPYEYLYVKGDNMYNYTFTSDINSGSKKEKEYDYESLIHILEDEKLNRIGDREYDLSKSWYARNCDNTLMAQLKNNITNYFINKQKTKTAQNMWTTFSPYKSLLSNKGYGRGFVPLNARSSNEYASKTSIAYVVNRYVDPGIKNFFQSHGVTVDEDGYAVSEMLQFIWRSAIRNGEEINIYIPSIRMRKLLIDWIYNESVKKLENSEK